MKFTSEDGQAPMVDGSDDNINVVGNRKSHISSPLFKFKLSRYKRLVKNFLNKYMSNFIFIIFEDFLNGSYRINVKRFIKNLARTYQ